MYYLCLTIDKDMKPFTKFQTEEIIGLLDVRYDTIEDDPESADDFETVESLNTLRGKLQMGATDYTLNEAKWIIQELENRKGVAHANDGSISFGEKNSFINSLDSAIGKLCEAHRLDIDVLMQELNDI